MKNKITWIEPYYDLMLNKIPLDTRSVLDVGAGKGIFGFILRNTRDLTTLDAVEPFEHGLGHYDNVWKQTWQEWFENNREKKYDIVVAFEMIEHLTREDAMNFLKQVKCISKKAIIVTPIKFERQEEYEQNVYQTHRSLMTAEDFRLNGFNVEILGTLNKFRTLSRIVYNRKLRSFMKMVGVKETNIMAYTPDGVSQL